jgi:hypothetical protein
MMRCAMEVAADEGGLSLLPGDDIDDEFAIKGGARAGDLAGWIGAEEAGDAGADGLCGGEVRLGDAGLWRDAGEGVDAEGQVFGQLGNPIATRCIGGHPGEADAPGSGEDALGVKVRTEGAGGFEGEELGPHEGGRQEARVPPGDLPLEGWL